MRDLGIDLLRTFVAIVDAEGFTRAGERLGRTQPAVSLAVRRLEAAVGRPLFVRGSPRPALSQDGEVLLGYARRILRLHDEALSRFRRADLSGSVRLGTPEDFATVHLSDVLARFAAENPRVAVEVECDFTRNLERAFQSGAFDLVLLKREPGPPRPETTVWRERLIWAAKTGFVPDEGPLPLLLAPPPDVYRARALAALDAAGLPWRIAYVSPSLAGLLAAGRAGLGVTVLAEGMLQPGLAPPPGLPTLADTEIALVRAPDLSAAAEGLAAHIVSSLHRRQPVYPG